MGAHRRELSERIVGSDGVDDDIDCGSAANELFWAILPGILGAATALVLMTALLYWPYQWSLDDGKYPEYSVAVAGFSGLDPSHATLDATFDLTVRIKEPRKYSTACVQRGTVAAVSYRGVALAHGPVPEFCGRNEGATEAKSVMAWGNAVPVPQFARDRLAEELRQGRVAVEVILTAPARYCMNCHQMVVECKAVVGRGDHSPPCRVTFDIPTFPDNPDGMLPPPRFLRTL